MDSNKKLNECKYHAVFFFRRDTGTGNIYLDSFISYTDQDIKENLSYYRTIDNPLWEGVSKEMALKISGMKNNIIHSIEMIKLRSRFNEGELCHFASNDFPITIEICNNIIDAANSDDKDSLKILTDSIIRN